MWRWTIKTINRKLKLRGNIKTIASNMYGDMPASSDKTHRLTNIQAGCCHIDEAG